MRTIYPKSKKDENLFIRLSRYPVFETNDAVFTRTLHKKYATIFDNGYLKIKRNQQKQESAIYIPEGIRIAPLPKPKSRNAKFSKFGFFRSF